MMMNHLTSIAISWGLTAFDYRSRPISAFHSSSCACDEVSPGKFKDDSDN